MTGERIAPGRLMDADRQFRDTLLRRAVDHDRVYLAVIRPGADAQRNVWRGIHGTIDQMWSAGWRA